MDDPRPLHRRAGELTGELIDTTTPAQLGLPTPCSQWDVRAVINHLVNANLRVTARLAGESGPERGDDVLGADPAADFRSSFEGLCAAFDEDGFLERTVPTPFGDGPGARLVGLRVTELTIHAWDLAAATGQSRIFDPELVRFAGAIMHAQPIPRSSGGPFGPEQVVPGLATDADLLAAYAGRAVPAVKRVWQLPEVTRATPEAGPTGR